jgi:competence ComEA-like helix-hairpin-helix protein
MPLPQPQSWRRSLGLALILLTLLGGRALRQAVLMGPNGQWRDPLWLDSVLPPAPVQAAPVKALPPAGPFNVNTAPADTLVFLPGIGPKLAARLIAERESGGRFVGLEDLQRVKGIGPKLAERIASKVIFSIPSPQPETISADTTSGDVRAWGP